MAVDWRVYLPQSDTYESDLLDVYVRDAYNRFARKADILLDDPDGTKPLTYTRGLPVDLEVNDGSGWEKRWGGFVINPQTKENETEVELYSHDFWLRKRSVLTNYTAITIEDMLKDLITRLTPLKWNPDLVEVVDDATFDVQWKGQQLDQVIDEVSNWSAGEVFGATNNREFFFQPADLGSSPRDFTRGDYFEAEFDEDGTREINQVTVYFGEGDNTGAVTVDDRDSQEELASDIGSTTERVILDITRSFPEITTEDAARRKARDILTGRTTIRTGSVKTWEGFGVTPGDIATVEVPEQDVNDDYRVAQIEYNWIADETTVTFAETGQGVIDTLVDLSNEVERVESRAADSSATITQYTSLNLPLELTMPSMAVYSRTIPNNMFLSGPFKGNLGHESVGGGFLGDLSGDKTKEFEV